MGIRDLVHWNRDKGNVPVRRSDMPFLSLQREMNQLFDRFFEGFDVDPFDWSKEMGGFQPRVDVSETDREIKICAELPGVDEKDIDVSLDDGVLTIKGERKSETENEGKDYYRREQFYGSFQRSIALPAEIDPDKVQASFKRGVLTVALPKTATSARKKISVQTS